MEAQQLNELTYKIIGCAYRVHSALGPGLLESAYQACLEYELLANGLSVRKEYPIPVIYGAVKLDAGYRVDLIVNDEVILELKSTEGISPIHKAQMITYIKLSKKKIGLLLNFNVTDMQKGIQRIVLKEHLHEFND
jgi:GxxExxY protein